MKRGGGVPHRNDDNEAKIGGVTNKKKMKKNMQRLGGRGGLSLASFANAKARNDTYNPSVIKKQREFYKNAKYVKKYKKSLNQQERQSTPSTAQELLEGENGGGNASQKKMKYKKNARNLQELYEKKHGEQEKDRIEREAMMQAKKEEREAAEARRRALKEKMYKKTRSGQPVMKYRIEHMLEAIQGSTS
ncbi:uncharacterized protein LOC125219356 [Salvia hispanica]|uniref:uncharacterized protein LOC125219356 n=1 Tax=Salvia hispanica TaxID=49212 RepID=UPI0020096947|nr:uncharacterized protein LOC125219356 [Salvia hispanica]